MPSWFIRLQRRALTKPLWWWHKRRPWPIRQRVFRLPPSPVPAEARTRLVVLTTPSGVADAAWSARSFIEGLDLAPADRLALDLYLDSPDPGLLRQTNHRWTRLFPGSGVHPTWKAVAAIEPGAPALAALAKVHPMVRKLTVVLHAQEGGNVIFSDSDVLLFDGGDELAAAARGGEAALYNQESGELNADERLLERARRAGCPPPAARFNSGLLYLPRRCLSIPEAERLLALGADDPVSYFIDQTVLALLLGARGARPLPPERYLVSPQGQFYGEEDADYTRLALRHFTTPVRYLMYRRGMPLLWRRWLEKSS